MLISKPVNIYGIQIGRLIRPVICWPSRASVTVAPIAAIRAATSTNEGSMIHTSTTSVWVEIWMACRNGTLLRSTRMGMTIKSSQARICVRPTQVSPMILPAMNWFGETEVMITSMVRFSFSSTTACIR